MASFDASGSSKIDATVGLLANVPQEILNKIISKLNLKEDENRKIELTILYRDNPEATKDFIEGLGGEFLDLGFNFAIVKVPIDKLEELAGSNEIQYIELPKSLYESDLEANRASCIPQAVSTYDVTGKGVLIGFIDSGIDYTHPAFMDENGNTRIEYIYDLTNDGAVYNKTQINQAIKTQNPYSIVPVTDLTGHGTHVVGDACAGGRIPSRYKGAAPKASIAMVKGGRGNWVLSSEIMMGLKFLIDKSKELNMPLIVNISLSTNNGAHNGTSLLEQYVRTVANLEKVTIIVAAGNEGDAGHHTGDKFKNIQSESFSVASDETSLVLNLYKSILPDISIRILGPTGEQSGSIQISQGYFKGNVGRDRYDIYVSGPKPFELNSEVQIIISSISSTYLVEGTWSIEISVLNNYEGQYSIWLPISEGLNPKTKFLAPKQLNTLGIPATVENIIAVGSYNSITNTLSTFSGRGQDTNSNNLRPDVAAPGENILGPLPGGGYDSKTGTSMATPEVAGICALMTEWGIIKGNDPYLFGQRLKYYLVKGANRSRTDITYPNPLWGYGTVCTYDSMYILENAINGILARNEDDYNLKKTYREKNENAVQANNANTNINTTSQGTSTGNNNLNNTTGVINTNSAITNNKDNSGSSENKSALNSLTSAIEGSDVDRSEIVGLLVRYTSPDELKAVNNIPNTSAVAISDSVAAVRTPIGEINKLKSTVKEIVTFYNPPVYTLTALSPVDASGASLFSENPYLLLDGTDVVVGIIDTGIDYLNKEFMLEDDTTRILSIWDQTIDGNVSVEGINFGSVYTEDQINAAIKISMDKSGDPYSIVPSRDTAGHGTMSAGIIGGRGINPDLVGAAPNCKFIVVKVKELSKFVMNFASVNNNYPGYGTVDLILAIRYLSIQATKIKKPMVIYFPFGTNVGAHDGTADIERFFETEGQKVGVIPVVGTGNQGDTQTHIEGKIANTGDIQNIQIKVGKNEIDLNFEIYCSKPDTVSLGIVSPSGEVLEKVSTKLGEIVNYKFTYEGTTASFVYLLPDEVTGDETIIVKFKNIREGTWQFRLYGDKIVDGRYWAWLPQRELLDQDTRFFDPIQRTTLTIPSTARGVIATSYYNQDLNTTVPRSGRGYTRDGRIKPDITAGGVNAIVATPNGGTATVTGSSIATSVLAGCCALMLQWAIINKNDPEISAKKLISYIIRGAKMRQGDIYPNIDWGYGILDIQNIFNSFRKNKLLKLNTDDENIKYIEFNEAVKNIDKQEYKELTIGNLFVRIPKIKLRN